MNYRSYSTIHKQAEFNEMNNSIETLKAGLIWANWDEKQKTAMKIAIKAMKKQIDLLGEDYETL